MPKQQARHARRNREGKSRMRDELCEDHDCERKYAVKLLRALAAAMADGPKVRRASFSARRACPVGARRGGGAP